MQVDATIAAASSSTYEMPEVEDFTPDESTFPKRPLRVFSFCYGVAAGLYILDQLDLDVEVYFATEISGGTKTCSSFAERITNAGDIRSLSREKLEKMAPIDLVLGGFPCSVQSRKSCDKTTAEEFFQFYRVMTTLELLSSAKGVHLFWLFENVSNMSAEFKSTVCS
ncbi:hypothetical protein SK128_013965 [Halocaridina rubra]|uniref:DNA (cytosine-5-)-methyltransferase n=1 Tax=Halocaridina rubra TaxID=373956 RepID=A0AAN8WW53_HALRR